MERCNACSPPRSVGVEPDPLFGAEELPWLHRLMKKRVMASITNKIKGSAFFMNSD